MRQYTLLFISLLLLSCPATSSAQDVQLDSTFLTASDLATGLQVPWEVKWGQDDHLWVTERRGRILRIDPTNGNTVTVLDYEDEVLEETSEYGMLGMTLHPEFPSTPILYVVYCYRQGGSIRERLSAFRWDGTELDDETIIFNDIRGAGIHNGSRLLITTDNKILMTTGDRGNGDLSQETDNLNGKILRMNLDGSIPDDNPIPGSYIYSYGHRNAQGLAYGPNGQIYSSEHGAQQWDEFNLIEPNRNYGWPEVQGTCNTATEMIFCDANNVREPLSEWAPCVAVNDIIYYDHPAIPEWEGKMLMAVLGGFVGDPRLSILTFNEDGTEVINEDEVLDNIGRIRDVAINPHTGSVYIATNGFSYPGFGPNRIIELRNEAFMPSSVNTPNNPEQFVQVRPNPVSDQLQVQLSDNFIGQPLEVHSFNGQQVLKTTISSARLEIPASDWAPGMYFLRATNEEGTITRTFAVQ
ncbi:MAG: PQQ-dependent sugar dehydrogenase [Bacteroidota bacterium]